MTGNIIARGFYGRDFEHDFAKPTVLTGPIGAGKTMILRAIRVAVLGYDPEIGRQTGATAALFGKGGGRVEFTAGQESFSTEIVMDRGKPKLGHNASKVVPELNLNPELFLNAGATERARIIREMFPDDGFVGQVRNLIKKAGVELQFGDDDDLSDWLKNSLRPEIKSLERLAEQNRARLAMLQDVAMTDAKETDTEALMAAYDAANKIRDKLGEAHLMHANLVKEIAENEAAIKAMKLPDKLPTQADLNLIISTIGGLQENKRTHEAELKRLEELGDASECPLCHAPLDHEPEELESLSHHIDQIETKLNELDANRSQVEHLLDTAAEMAELKEKLSELKHELEDWPAVGDAAVKEAEARATEARDALRSGQEAAQAIARAKASIRERTTLETEIGKLAGKVEAMKDLDKDLGKLAKEQAGKAAGRIVEKARETFQAITGMGLACDGLVFSFEKDGKQIVEKSFSGGQRAALWLAVAMAFTEGFPLVLMDELGRFDARSKLELLSHVDGEFEGVFIATDPNQLTDDQMPAGSDIEIKSV